MIRATTVILCVALASPTLASPPIKGVALGLYFDEADREGYSFFEMLRELKDTGADHVSLVVAWGQHDVRSNTIAANAQVTISDQRLRALIRHAHALGLKVLVFPILELTVRRPLEWRGTLAPGNVDAWWRSYENFIAHYARIAAEERVALFSIGSELNSTEAWQERWFHLVGRIKRLYPGPLIYSSNWDHYENVTFWPRIDYIGVTAYNELTKNADASEAELTKAWQEIRKTLVAFAQKAGRPLVITEIGYVSRDGAAVHPWDYTSRTPVDLEEQRRCYAAFVAAWQTETLLAGVFWWNWFGPGGQQDTYYTPKGKPAETVVRTWYGRARPTPP